MNIKVLQNQTKIEKNNIIKDLLFVHNEKVINSQKIQRNVIKSKQDL